MDFEPRCVWGVLILVVGMAGSLATTAEARVPGTQSERGSAPRIVCITDMDPFLGIYASRPLRCLLHEYRQPFTAGTLLNLKRMRWRSWGPGRARGKGEVLTNAGVYKVRLSLSRVREICGERVFTRVRVHTRKGEGKGHWTFRPDICLR